MVRKLTTFIFTFLMASAAFSQQIISVNDNMKVTARIAGQDLNRIAVEGDRIKSVKGLEEQYTLSQDVQLGQIYLKSLVPSQQPINLFLTTESNKNYQLELRPTSKSSETVILKPEARNSKQALSNYSLSTYEQMLISLVRAMATDELLDDDEITASPQSKSIVLSDNIEMTRLKTVSSGELQGEVYRLQNKSSQPLALTESQFYRPHTLAISIEDATVSSQGFTDIYIVRKHG